MAFLPNLAAEMDRYSITEEDIAEAASCDVEEVKSWFKGDHEPTFAQANAIRDLYFPMLDFVYLFERGG